MVLYRLKEKCGDHTEQGKLLLDGKREQILLKSGMTIETDVDMIVKFPNKFERVFENTQPVNVDVKQPTIPVPHDKVEGSIDAKLSSTDFSQEVTSSFKIAEENGLQVFEKDGKYTVLRNGEVINEKSLNTKDDVVEFLAPLVTI